MMKTLKTITALLAAGLLCCIAVSGVTLADSGKTLSVGWDTWEPYQYADVNGKISGLDIELLEAVCQASGYSLKYEQLPWKRCLVHIERGITDVSCGASKTEDREAFAYFSDPFRPESVALFVRAGEAAKFPLNSLSGIVTTGFRLGATAGYYYGEEYEKLIQQPAFKELVQEINDEASQIKKLIKNRIDGFLMDPIVANNFIRQQKAESQVEIHPLPVFSNDVFIIFSKKSTSPEIVADFNQGLKKIKENGVYAEIFQRYAP